MRAPLKELRKLFLQGFLSGEGGGVGVESLGVWGFRVLPFLGWLLLAMFGRVGSLKHW